MVQGTRHKPVNLLVYMRLACALNLAPFLYLVPCALNPLLMGVLKQIAEYLYLRKPDPNRPKTNFVKYMHGINRLSILLFLLALFIMLFRLIFKKG